MSSPEMKWYAVGTFSGYENRARQLLAENIKNNARRDPPKDVAVPAWVRRIIERGLATNAADRYQALMIGHGSLVVIVGLLSGFGLMFVHISTVERDSLARLVKALAAAGLTPSTSECKRLLIFSMKC